MNAAYNLTYSGEDLGLLAGGESQSVVALCRFTDELGGGGVTCVVLLIEGFILAGCEYFSICIDTCSDVGIYTLYFTVIYATDTGGS